MSERPTPETDAAAEKNIYGVAYRVDVDFARKLERERDEAREEITKLKFALEKISMLSQTTCLSFKAQSFKATSIANFALADMQKEAAK